MAAQPRADKQPPPAPGEWLRVLLAGSATWHRLTGAEVTLGRDAACTVPLAAAGVSSCHAVLTRTTEGWLLRDRQSTSGLWHGGCRVTAVTLVPGEAAHLGPATVLLCRQPG
jgi:pSer/pThr/pTyr-binding forkhead associated (FHA) protein